MLDEIMHEAPKLRMDEREAMLESLIDKLQLYFDDEILGQLVDLVQDNDDEYYMQLHGLQIQGLHRLLLSPIDPNNKRSESPQSRGSMSLRRRRSGLRSNRKRLVNTVNEGID